MLNFRKLLLLSLTLTILSGLMIGCNDDDNDGDPVPTSLEAAFSYDCGDCTAPAETEFTNESSGADEYNWSFGNGHTSNEENPVHTYSHPDDYEVTLRAYQGNQMEEITKTITIEEEEEESEYFRYEVDGDLIEASYFEAEIIENDDDRLRIWGGADEAKEDYPQFLISLNEPNVTGFTAGVNFMNRDESIPEDTLSFTGAAETRYSSTYTPDEEEYDGMFFFIEEIDRGEDGYIQGDFSGSITTEDHQEEISISNGELRVKF